MRPPFVFLAAVATILLAACSSGPTSASDPEPTRKPPSFLSILTASGTPATLHVDVADDGDERGRGLMGVEQLPRDQGMAFVWDEPVTTTFWMKDTLVPLSIAFWDTDGRIIDILDMEPCTSDPCPTYRPDAPYVGAVEANAGWFAEHDVAVGDHVELEVRAYA